MLLLGFGDYDILEHLLSICASDNSFFSELDLLKPLSYLWLWKISYYISWNLVTDLSVGYGSKFLLLLIGLLYPDDGFYLIYGYLFFDLNGSVWSWNSSSIIDERDFKLWVTESDDCCCWYWFALEADDNCDLLTYC